MSRASDEAKKQIEKLLDSSYPQDGFLHNFGEHPGWHDEYKFDPNRKYRFDYAVPSIKCAIEIQGGLFIKGAHSNPAALKKNYERMNRAQQLGWRVFQYTPDQVVKCMVGRKTKPDEIIPILTKLPWL